MTCRVVLLVALAAATVPAQEAPQGEKGKPQVKINYINVCAPSEDERKEMSAALARIPAKSSFSADFEVSRGHTTQTPESIAFAKAALPGAVEQAAGAESSWVRIRRD